jgi:hypothetical protein
MMASTKGVDIMDAHEGDLKNMDDLECTAHGRKLAHELTPHQLRKVLDGLIAGHYELRAEQPSAGDAMLGPDKHISRAAEMLGSMEFAKAHTQSQVNA